MFLPFQHVSVGGEQGQMVNTAGASSPLDLGSIDLGSIDSGM